MMEYRERVDHIIQLIEIVEKDCARAEIFRKWNLSERNIQITYLLEQLGDVTFEFGHNLELDELKNRLFKKLLNERDNGEDEEESC